MQFRRFTSLFLTRMGHGPKKKTAGERGKAAARCAMSNAIPVCICIEQTPTASPRERLVDDSAEKVPVATAVVDDGGEAAPCAVAVPVNSDPSVPPATRVVDDSAEKVPVATPVATPVDPPPDPVTTADANVSKSVTSEKQPGLITHQDLAQAMWPGESLPVAQYQCEAHGSSVTYSKDPYHYTGDMDANGQMSGLTITGPGDDRDQLRQQVLKVLFKMADEEIPFDLPDASAEDKAFFAIRFCEHLKITNQHDPRFPACLRDVPLSPPALTNPAA
jgi:hypothetical protein